MVEVVSVEELQGLSGAERAELLRALIALGDEDPLELPQYRRRGVVLVFLVACCVWLVPWTVALGFTLPQHYTSGQWAVAWIGFDVALTAAFAFTAVAVWRRLQIAIVGQVVTGSSGGCSGLQTGEESGLPRSGAGNADPPPGRVGVQAARWQAAGLDGEREPVLDVLSVRRV